MTTLLLARQLLTPLERIDDAAVLIEDGTISAAGRRAAVKVPLKGRVVDFGDAIFAPGLIDIHIHGGAGRDVMEASDDSLAAVEQMLAQHGVASYCPTTVTAPLDQTLRSLEALGKAVERARSDGHSKPLRARPLGIHLEGPFLSQARRGVHPPLHLQPPSLEMFNQMWDAAGGHISMLTIAPELDGALDVITEASQRGVCVSIGHSNATLAQARAGFRAGARHATHTFNSMRRLDHRDSGVLGAILTDRGVTADIIADGVHVDPVVVDLFMRAKGVEGAVLITDGISATGMPDGIYHLGLFEVELTGERCLSYGKLAGSVLTLDRAVGNAMTFARLSFQDSLRLATLNPARVLGIAQHKGMLQAGADADITVFTPEGEVMQTIVNGVVN